MSRIVDLSGRPLKAGEERGIVDRNGQRIAAERHDGVPSPGKDVGKIGINGMIVACHCSDGNFRQVILKDKEAHKVWELIRRLHKGDMRLQIEPVFLIVRTKDGQPPKPLKPPSFFRGLFKRAKPDS